MGSHVCMYMLANTCSAALHMGGGSSPPCPELTSPGPGGGRLLPAVVGVGRSWTRSPYHPPRRPGLVATISAWWSPPHTSPQLVHGSAPSQPAPLQVTPLLCVIRPITPEDGVHEG